MKEKWKPIIGFDGYEISNLGNVRSYIRRQGKMEKSHYLHAITIKGGYKVIRLNKADVKNKGYLIHRLVYEAFVGKIPHGMEINHKDQNTANNSLCNLEICTHKYNVNYADGIKRRVDAMTKRVIGISPDGEKHFFNSPKLAAIAAGTKRVMVYSIVHGRKKTVHGWRFSYVSV